MKNRSITGAIILAAGLFLLTGSSDARAQEKLYYAGGYLDYVMENLDDGSVADEFRNPIGVSFENAFGVGARLGMMLREYLSAEVMLQYLTPFEDTSEGKTAEISVINAGINLKAALVYFGDLEPYVLGGLGLLYADRQIKFEDQEVSDTNWGLDVRLGAGLDYRLSREMSVGAEMAYVKGIADTDYVSYIDFSVGVSVWF